MTLHRTTNEKDCWWEAFVHKKKYIHKTETILYFQEYEPLLNFIFMRWLPSSKYLWAGDAHSCKQKYMSRKKMHDKYVPSFSPAPNRRRWAPILELVRWLRKPKKKQTIIAGGIAEGNLLIH